MNFFNKFFGAKSEKSEQQMKAFVAQWEQTIGKVQVGNQLWMTENLKLQEFRNGEKIPNIYKGPDWMSAIKNNKPACCLFEDLSYAKDQIGFIYNWDCIIDRRNIAPYGWRVPTEDDWMTLIKNLLGEKYKINFDEELLATKLSEALKMKLIGHYRNIEGSFIEHQVTISYFYSSTEDSLRPHSYRYLRFAPYPLGTTMDFLSKDNSCYVRLVKDIGD